MIPVKKSHFIPFFLFIFSNFVLANTKNFSTQFTKAAQKSKKAVVNITVYQKFNENKGVNFKKITDSSATIISKDGFLVTNYHVVKNGNYYKITGPDGYKYEVQKFKNNQFYKADLKTDIALLKIKLPTNFELTPIKISDSNKLQEGEWIIAIGNPYGLKQSITCGIISSIGRDNIGFTDIEDFIQFDASINPGNSGGPLVNLKGEMVGLNTAIKTNNGGYQGISFAIPSNITRHVCQELKNYGRVRRGWLGFLSKETKTSPWQEDNLIEIISVIKNSPADFIGLQEQDIIKSIDHQPITSLSKLIKLVGNKKVGSKIIISIIRGENSLNFELTLRERQIYKKIRDGIRNLFFHYGIEVDENAKTNEVLISYLSPKNIIYDLKKGDIIVALNENKIFSLENFISVFERFDKKINSLKVYREKQLYTINLKTEEKF